MTMKKKLAGVSKTKKIIIAGVSILVVGGIGGTVYASNQSQQRIATETQNKLDETTDTLSSLTKKIQALFDSKDQNYLAKDVTDQQVNELKKQVENECKGISKEALADNKAVDKVTFEGYDKAKSDATTQLEKAEKLVATQSTVNLFFKKDEKTQALNGTDVNKELPIVDNLKKETIDTARKELESEKVSAPFKETITSLLKIAEDQVKQIEKAKSEVTKIYKDGKVSSTDKKLYDTAKIETDKIKNEKAKKELSGQLSKVKAEIEKKDKEESKKGTATNDQKQENTNRANPTNQQAKQTEVDNAIEGNTASGHSDNGTSGGGSNDAGYTPPTNNGNGGGGYTPPADNGNSNGGGGSTGGGSTPPDNGGNGGSNGGGAVTPPAGTVGPFYSEDECWAYAEAHGWSGFAVTIINGAMYISQR